MKVFLVGKQHWTRKDPQTGETNEGESYIGFLPSGVPIKFTSMETYTTYPGEVGFDAARAIEIPIIIKMFGGKVKYQDGKSYGKEDADH